jgi:hypothetical protein
MNVSPSLGLRVQSLVPERQNVVPAGLLSMSAWPERRATPVHVVDGVVTNGAAAVGEVLAATVVGDVVGDVVGAVVIDGAAVVVGSVVVGACVVVGWVVGEPPLDEVVGAVDARGANGPALERRWRGRALAVAIDPPMTAPITLMTTSAPRTVWPSGRCQRSLPASRRRRGTG